MDSISKVLKDMDMLEGKPADNDILKIEPKPAELVKKIDDLSKK